MATPVISRIRKQFKVELRLPNMFESSTCRQFGRAAVVDLQNNIKPLPGI